MRILEVNNHSLLGMTHTEAVRVLRSVGDSLGMLVCDGFDPGKVTAVEVMLRQDGEWWWWWWGAVMCDSSKLLQPEISLWTQASPGVIANPFAAGIVRKNSMESISSIDRDLSPEEIDIMQKVQDAVEQRSDHNILSKLGSEAGGYERVIVLMRHKGAIQCRSACEPPFTQHTSDDFGDFVVKSVHESDVCSAVLSHDCFASAAFWRQRDGFPAVAEVDSSQTSAVLLVPIVF